MLKKLTFLILLRVLVSVQLQAREQKTTFKDILDGKFDMGEGVIHKHGKEIEL